MNKSIRIKILISMTFTIIVTVTFLGLINYRDSRELATEIIKESNRSEINNIREYYFEKLIYDMEYIIGFWSENQDIVNYEKDENQGKYVRDIPENFKDTHKQMKRLVDSLDSITWIYLALEKDGSIFIAPVDETMPLDYDARTREWYRGTVENQGEIYWTDPYIDAGESGKLIQTVSKGVYKDNKLIGVVGLDIELGKFTEIINDLSYSKNSYIYLLNEKREVLAHSVKAPESIKLQIHNLAEKEKALVEIKSLEYVVSSAPISINNWRLVVVTRTNLESNISQIRIHILGIATIATLIGVLVSIILSKHLLKPLNSLIVATDHVSKGNFKIRVYTKSKDEFKKLSNSFNQMLDYIEDLINERDENYLKTVTTLANAIEASDEYTRGHCDRVGSISLKIAEKMNLTREQIKNLQYACILHDIGKIGISDTILNKPSALTEGEYEIIKKHPQIGHDIINGIDFLKEPSKIILEHHERIDGKGYPNQIRGPEISIEAKILTVADTYDSISSKRIYREKIFTDHEIEMELIENSGSQLDEEVVRALLEILKEDKL